MVELFGSEIINPEYDFKRLKKSESNLFDVLSNLSTDQIKSCESLLEGLKDRKELIKRITLQQLKDLNEKGVSTEMFLDYLCKKEEFLLHGSTDLISQENIISRKNKIFATDCGVIAILKSLYSNKGVNLEYPKIINKNNFKLKIHTPSSGKFLRNECGFIYIIKKEGFKKSDIFDREYTLNSKDKNIDMIIETKIDDYKYPVEVIKDYK